HTFYALDALTGKPAWTYKGTENYSIAAAGAEGKVFAGNDDLKMYCLNATSGKLLWKTPINSMNPLLSSPPAIASGMLFMGSTDGNVYALDTRNGAIKWKFKTQRPIVSSPAIGDRGVCVGSQDGNLYFLE